MAARKISRVTAEQMDATNSATLQLFKKYCQGDDAMSEGQFAKCCQDSNFADSKFMKNPSLIFAQVKLRNKKTIKHQQFQDALRAISREKEVTYQALVELATTGNLGSMEFEEDFDVQLERSLTHDGSHRVAVEDFDLIKVLGKGSFGKVMLVRRKTTSVLYAMKTLRKAQLIKRNQLVHTKAERNIYQYLKSPFLTHLAYAFQTEFKLYLVLDYCAGGELFFWLQRHRRFSVNRVRLYAAEIVLGLQCLHDNDIVYRDLKPENLLLDSDGHLRLTDFGLSKEGITGAGAQGGTKTFCGTPEYLAPELIQNRGHGKAVDWWSLGTLMYEMLSGLPPFYDQNMQRMYDKILHQPLKFAPRPWSHADYTEVRDLLQKMLNREVEARFGSKGPDEIKQHPFFSVGYMDPGTKSLIDWNWEAVYEKRYTCEFVPPNRDATDTSNFEAEFTSQKPEDSVVNDNMLSETQIEKSRFADFTFTDADSELSRK